MNLRRRSGQRLAQAALWLVVGADRAVDRVAHAAFPVTFLTVVIARVEFPQLVSAVSGELLRGKLLAQLTVEPAVAEGAVTCLARTLVRPTHQVVRGKRYAARGDEEPGCEVFQQPVVGLTYYKN